MDGRKCPVEDCDYVLPECEDTLAAAFLTGHLLCHSKKAPAVKMESVKRPTITASGTSAAWTYFLRRWESYVDATHASGRDRIHQLIECCDGGMTDVWERQGEESVSLFQSHPSAVKAN